MKRKWRTFRGEPHSCAAKVNVLGCHFGYGGRGGSLVVLDEERRRRVRVTRQQKLISNFIA
jgi:hypothetical protein